MGALPGWQGVPAARPGQATGGTGTRFAGAGRRGSRDYQVSRAGADVMTYTSLERGGGGELGPPGAVAPPCSGALTGPPAAPGALAGGSSSPMAAGGGVPPRGPGPPPAPPAAPGALAGGSSSPMAAGRAAVPRLDLTSRAQ